LYIMYQILYPDTIFLEVSLPYGQKHPRPTRFVNKVYRILAKFSDKIEIDTPKEIPYLAKSMIKTDYFERKKRVSHFYPSILIRLFYKGSFEEEKMTSFLKKLRSIFQKEGFDIKIFVGHDFIG